MVLLSVHRTWLQVGAAVLVLLGVLHLDDRVALEARSSLNHRFLESHEICKVRYVELCSCTYHLSNIAVFVVNSSSVNSHVLPFLAFRPECGHFVCAVVFWASEMRLLCFTAARRRRVARFTTI